MIFCFLFIIGSAIFGFSIISLFNSTQGLIVSQILSGWCLGSMIISSIAFITSYFFKLTFAHSIVLLIFMFSVSLIIIIYHFVKNRKMLSNIRFEKIPSFYFSLAVIGFFMLAYTNISYIHYPDLIPDDDRFIFETEHSFILSIINGINSHRKNFLTFSDPYLINQSYTISALPELYTACLVTLKANYAEATVLISFLSSISTAAAIYLLSYFYAPDSSALIVLLYFFNGGSSIYNFFNGPKNKIPSFILENLTMSLYPPFYSSNSTFILDGIHNCGRGETPHYSIFGVHLAFSKISDFSIPLAIFALSFLYMGQKVNQNSHSNHLLAGLLAAFIPSLSTSFIFFIIASNFSISFLRVMPFSLSLIPKIYKSFYIIYPVWREYQMNGIFFSQIVTFYDSIGIPYLSIFLFPLFFFDYTYFHRFISMFAGFLVLCFVREGNDTFANDIALSALCVSSFTGNFVYIINKLKSIIIGRLYFSSKSENRSEIFDDEENEKIEDKSEEQNKNEGQINFKDYSQFLGIFNFFYYFLILYIILSGFLNIKILSEIKNEGIGENSLHCGNMVSFYSKPNDVILTDAKGMNPAVVLSGRQVIMGKASDLWRRGEDTKSHAELFERLSKENGFIDFMEKENIQYLLEFKFSLFALPNDTYLEHFKVLSENNDWVLFSLNRHKTMHYHGFNFKD